MKDETLPKIIANIIINFALKYSKQKKCSVNNLGISPKDVSILAWMIKLQIIDMTKASIIFDEMAISNKSPGIIAYELDLYPKKDDDDKLEKWVKEALKQNPKAVKDIHSGKEKACGSIIGQVMRLSKGKADAKDAKEMILKLVKV